MIVGRGLIAAAFADRFSTDPSVTIFASGVSNSTENGAEAFLREEGRLRDTLAEDPGCLVYFGTCSVGDHERKATPYVQHKLRMEKQVASTDSYLIIRLPQVVGRTGNPFTLTNYLHAQIASGVPFAVWKNARRNIIDIDDVALIASRILDGAYRNRIVNIASPSSVRVVDLVAIFERVLGVTANCELVDRGDHYDIDVGEAMKVAHEAGLKFEADYVEKVIKKYYARSRSSP